MPRAAVRDWHSRSSRSAEMPEALVGAPVGRVDRHSVRTVVDRLVRSDGIAGDFYPRKDRRLVQTPAGDRGSQARRCGNGFRAQPAAAENPHGPRHSGHSGLFEVFLHRFDDELLYVFPDGQVRRIGARCAILSFRFSCGFGCGYVHRRTAGRPHRTQICDLGFDFWGLRLLPCCYPTSVWLRPSCCP